MSNIIDKAVGFFSPQKGVARLKARNALKVMGAYEATKPTRTRRNPSDNASGDALMELSATELRGQARHLEQNYDFASGILTSLVNNVVGPRGIGVEFQPKNKNGDLHQEFARYLNDRFKEWSRRPEVTRTMSFGKAQRLAALTWLRDGEVLRRDIEGSAPGIQNPTTVQFSIEVMEPDFLPHDLEDENKRIVQGVEKTAWGKPSGYWLYDEHPGGNKHWRMKTRRHSAENVSHLKMIKRLHQTRGVSIFACVMNRINDIKDYEESERVAARIAAAMVGYIKKGSPDEYTAPNIPEGESAANRYFGIQPGMIWDDLEAGEDVGMLQSNRPSGLLTPFLSSQHRMVAAGTMSNGSTITRDYNGTYSAQRQELVEQWSNYETLSCEFIDEFVEPPVIKWIKMLQLSRDFQAPGDVDLSTIFNVSYITPSMPWIDPGKEAVANEKNVAGVLEAPQTIIRKRGGNPQDVLDQTELWHKELKSRQIVAEKPTDEPPDKPEESSDSGEPNKPEEPPNEPAK